MRTPRRQPLPLAPLLRAYRDAGVPRLEQLGGIAGAGPRWQAILGARAGLLSERMLDGGSETDFQAALWRFYEACVQPPLHAHAVHRRAGLLRHALGHLLRCPEPLPRKLQRCLAVDGPYHVAGLGPAFWSAAAQGIDPARHPAWLPGTEAALRRLGLATWAGNEPPETVYAGLLAAYQKLRALAPGLTALHVDHFLLLVSRMQ